MVFYWFPQRKIDKRVWKKIEQLISEAADKICEDISEAYVLLSRLTAIELQAITQKYYYIGINNSYATYYITVIAVIGILVLTRGFGCLA